MARHTTHIGVDGHTVVVEDHDQRLTGGARIVKSLKAQPAAQRTVTDQRQHAVRLVLQRPRPRHTQRHGH